MAVAGQLESETAWLLNAIQTRALRTDGPFRLGSGGSSPYYLDIRVLLNDGVALSKIARLILKRIPREANLVGGMIASSVPISSAIILTCAWDASLGRELHGFWVRAEEKPHGLRGLVSGTVHPGDRAVVVDDVITQGNSVLRVVDALAELEAHVVKVVAVVDRGEGAREKLNQRGIPFDPLLTIQDVLGP